MYSTTSPNIRWFFYGMLIPMIIAVFVHHIELPF